VDLVLNLSASLCKVYSVSYQRPDVSGIPILHVASCYQVCPS